MNLTDYIIMREDIGRRLGRERAAHGFETNHALAEHVEATFDATIDPDVLDAVERGLVDCPPQILYMLAAVYKIGVDILAFPSPRRVNVEAAQHAG